MATTNWSSAKRKTKKGVSKVAARVKEGTARAIDAVGSVARKAGKGVKNAGRTLARLGD